MTRPGASDDMDNSSRPSASAQPNTSNVARTAFKPRRRERSTKRRPTRRNTPSPPCSTTQSSSSTAKPHHPPRVLPSSRPPLPTASTTPQPTQGRTSRWDSRRPIQQYKSFATRSSIQEPAENSFSSGVEIAVTTASATIATDDTDRDWYLGVEADTTQTLSTTAEDEQLLAARQARTLSARAAGKQDDVNRWESRQLSMGLYARGAASGNDRTDSRKNDVSDDSGPRLALLVDELKPPFLSCRDIATFSSSSSLTKMKPPDVTEPSETAGQPPASTFRSAVVIGDAVVHPVRDYTSNMAVIARRGSQTVSVFRENRERGRPRVKYWDLGTHAGAKEAADAAAEAERNSSGALPTNGVEKAEQVDDWKKDMKYADAMTRGKGLINESSKNVHGSRTISEVRRSLPVYGVREKLMNVIREHQVCVIVGETGSGKTTQIAQYLAEEGYARFGVIGCTQPRRVAAVSVAQRVAEEYNGGSQLGREVGYSIRFEDCTSKETRVKFMTDGILMRESLSDPELDRYSAIIMDEAHERSLNTDVLFGILRGVITRRRDLKVIVTSATMNADKFAAFFGDAPIFNIPGRTFPVDVFFSRNPVEDYVDGAVWQAVQLHIQAPVPGDILIFMTGQEDIEATCEALAEKVAKLESPKPLLILPIYSQLAADLQARIFEPAPEGTRKVVVATNIAETSLTIDGIKYVVDSGYCKLKTYNPRVGMDALLLCPASQSSANQRSGRAGRTGPGKCYRLYTSSAYTSELLETNVPEIQRTNLSHVLLLLKTLGVKELLEFPFLDPPPIETILKSMHGLWLIGALDNHGDLTEHGRRMSMFPLDPALSSLLFMGEKYGCLVEAITVVSMLSVPNAFVRPTGREEESDTAREKFFVPESDHLTLLHVYQRWRSTEGRADWCTKNYINNKSLRKAREVREQLLEIVRGAKIKETTTEDWDVVRKAIAFAFFYQAARRKGVGEYVNIRSGVVCGLHPTSAMYGSGMSPDYVVYHELIMTKKEYMSCVTAVEPHWLAEAGATLYILRQAGDEDLQLGIRLRKQRARIEDEIRQMNPT